MSYRPYSELKSSGVEDTKPNNTGVLISKGTPVRINSSGELDFINVTTENDALAVAGVVSEDIVNGASGLFVTTGKITDITTTANFGESLYVSKSGGLTNAKPSIGVDGFLAGDFVISVGVVSKNINNALLKDLTLNVDVIGQL